MTASSVAQEGASVDRTALSAESAVRSLEFLFCVIGLLAISDAVLPLLRHSTGQAAVTVSSGSQEGPVRATLLVLTAVLLVPRVNELRRAAWASGALWCLPLLSTISALWAADPSSTLRSSGALWSAMLLGAYLGLRFSFEEQVRVVTATMAILVLVSIVMAVVEPRLGIDVGPMAGLWRGAFVTKNAFGRAMAFAFAAFAVLFVRSATARWAGLLGLGASGLLIALSGSRTALLIALLVLAFVVSQRTVRRLPTSRAFIFAALSLLVVATILIAVLQGLQPAVRGGDPDVLTGRPRLWAAVLLMILQHPLLGFGYQSFWRDSEGGFVTVWQMVGWNPPHAHNGFLETALDLGLVGLVVLLLALSVIGSRALRALRTSSSARPESWPVAIVLFVLLANLSESTFLRSNIYWALLTAVSVTLSIRGPTTSAPPDAPQSLGRLK